MFNPFKTQFPPHFLKPEDKPDPSKEDKRERMNKKASFGKSMTIPKDIVNKPDRVDEILERTVMTREDPQEFKGMPNGDHSG